MKEYFKTVKFQDIVARQFPEDYVNHIINGDCIKVMRGIPDGVIDLIVTSPPYFVKKSYEKHHSFKDHEELMVNCFQQCARVLKPAGYAVFNFGDYFNSNRFYESKIPSVFPAAINYFQWGRSVGLDLQATRIWRKQFARMGIPMICNTHPRPVFDYEHVWTFRKPDGTDQEFVNDRKQSQKGVLGEGWRSSAKISDHEAAFPIELPAWAIDVYSSSENDTILDPFAGIGTTLMAAEMKNRRYIGIELSAEFCEMSYYKVQGIPTKKPR